MGPVASPKFREYVGDIALYAGFTDGELVGDLLVGVSVSDQPFVIPVPLDKRRLFWFVYIGEFRSALEDK